MLQPPATSATNDKTKVLFAHCSGFKGTGDDPDHYVEFGADRITKAVCEASSGVFTEKTCGDVKPNDVHELMYCCGKSPTYLPTSVSGNTKTTGKVKVEGFSDVACSTAATTIPAGEQHMVGKTHDLGACTKDPNGAHYQWTSCNGTDTTGVIVKYDYFDTACNLPQAFSMMALGCMPMQHSHEHRRLDGHAGGGNGTKAAATNHTSSSSGLGSVKITCTGEAAALKMFKTIMEVDFDIPTDITATEVTAIKTIFEKTGKDAFVAALAVASATITESHIYTGALNTRRQLSVRRKLSTTASTGRSEFTSSLPAAQADQANQRVQTAVTSGALTPAAFKGSLETAFTADDTLKNRNITASVHPVHVSEVVVKPEDSTSTTTGSTSSAFESCLGAVVGVLAGVMLLF